MNNNIIEALVLMVVGMSGVFFSLLLFYIIIVVLEASNNFITKRHHHKLASIAKQDVSDELPVELIAAISAAINTIFNKQVVIKKVHFVDSQEDDSWSRAARANIHDSHNIHLGY